MVMTCGCSSSRSRSGTRPARRSSTSARCRSSASAYGTTPRCRTSRGVIEVFEGLLHVHHEFVGHRTVDCAMVVAEAHVSPQANRDSVVHDDRPLLHGTDAKDRD